MEPFVSVERHDGVACIKVRIGDKHRRYVLTKAGCLQAGRELHAAGAESWMNSSSVDFPQEVKRGFKWDVRELMDEGFRAALEEFDRPRKELVDLIMAHCSKADFQRTLTPKQQALFGILKDKVKKGEG